MVAIKVKWGKETYDVEVDLTSTMQTLKGQLQSLTNVPADKQKIMGLKPAASKPETTLADAGVVAGKTIMLIGSAEGTAIPSAQAAEVEDTSGGHAITSATSNGLRNIANTCYLNAAIQLVRTMPEVKEALADYKGSNPVTKHLGGLLQALDATRDPVTPLALWTSLVQLNPSFGERDDHGAPMQQDAQEALNILLRSVDEALPAKYGRLYNGSLHKTLTCVDDPEDKATETQVSFTMLTCNITGEVQTLEAGLEKAFNESFAARSDRLGRDDASFKGTSRISALPEYLVVHMVRFSWRTDIQKKAKILKPITFPVVLDLSTLVTEELKQEQKPVRETIKARRDRELERRKRGRSKADNEEEEAPAEAEVVPPVLHNESSFYELCGVISHKGRSADGGHYVYWGKKSNQWLIYDDEHVAAVSEEDVKRLRGVAPQMPPQPSRGAPPQTKRIRRFSDVDTDSDVDAEQRDRPSAASPSLQTDAAEKSAGARGRGEVARSIDPTSEGSILFESASDLDLSPADAPAEKTTTVSAPSFQPDQQPQTLAEKLFGSIEAFNKPSLLQQQQPHQALQRPGSPPPVSAGKPEVAAEPAQSSPVGQPSPAAAPVSTAAPASQPRPKTRRAQQRQEPQPSPPGTALTTVYSVSKHPSDSLPRKKDGGSEAEEDSVDQSSGAEFAESILPTGKDRRPRDDHTQQPQPTNATPLHGDSHGAERSAVWADSAVGSPPVMARGDPSDELLIRARLRLEEKRRTEAVAAVAHRTTTPNHRSGGVGASAGSNGLLQSGSRGGLTSGGAHPHVSYPAHADPVPLVFEHSRTASPASIGRSGGYATPRGGAVGFRGDSVGAAPHTVEAKLRRLTMENTRLQEEVTFLNRENQKLRSVAGSADSTESVKMQLTVDVLRRELHAKELEHQSALRDQDEAKASLVRQVAELQDQNESYSATASQYRGLYEEKLKEVEQLKVQFQRLLQDVSSVEQRQGNDTQQHQAELALEREKTEKLLYLVEDLKRQRQHLHELNQQLQLELVGVKEEKSRLKDGLEAAEERFRQARAANEQTVHALQQDVARLRDSISEKDRSYTVQLREEQRMHANLQERLSDAVAEGKQEAERHRRAMEAIREDHKKALQAERERRSAVEEKLKRTEADSKASFASFKETVLAEHERKVKQLRDEAAAARQEADAARADAERLATEVEREHESFHYLLDQQKTLASDFAHSEEMRDKAERQCGALTATLQDMMQNDEEQTRRMAQLEGTVAELQQRLALTPYAGSATADVLGDVRTGAAATSLAAQVQLLSSENERLTNECVRLASERDTLVDDNGKIAEELLKWKNEMRKSLSAQLKQPQY